MDQDATGLLKGYDLSTLRAKTKMAPFAGLFDSIVQQARAAATDDRPGEPLTAGGWCHSLYFTPMVVEAGLVHRLTGEPGMADHVARQIDKLARVYADPPESFFKEIPALKRGTKPSAYFSSANTCLAAAMCRDALDQVRHRRLLDLVRDRLIDDCIAAEYFFTHFNAAHNAVVTKLISGAICALTFGHEAGCRQTDHMIELGRDACEMHLRWGFDKQGSPHEGPMYALVTLEWVFLYADLLRRHGGEDLFRTVPQFERIAQAAAEMQLPGITGFPGFADCRRLITHHPMPWLLLTHRAYGRELDLALWEQSVEDFDPRLPHHAFRPGSRGVPDWLWWEGQTATKQVQECGLPTAFFAQGTAVAALRSSWSDQAICLFVHGQGRSHNVPDHTHADAGHFSIYAHGDYLAYDTAYFNFDEDMHSVMLIDDKPHCHATQGNLYHGLFHATGRHALLDFVTINATAAKGCMWAFRTVLLVRLGAEEAYVVVLDNINRDIDVHNYKWQLQANLHAAIDVTGPDSAVVRGKTARLDCRFFSPAAADFPSSPHSLRVFADHHQHRNPADGTPRSNPRLVAEQVGPSCVLMSLVMPRRLNQAALKVTSRHGPRTFNVYVEHDHGVDQIVYACDHTFVRLEDLYGSSEVIVVRRDRSGTVTDTWTIDGEKCRPKERTNHANLA